MGQGTVLVRGSPEAKPTRPISEAGRQVGLGRGGRCGLPLRFHLRFLVHQTEVMKHNIHPGRQEKMQKSMRNMSSMQQAQQFSPMISTAFLRSECSFWAFLALFFLVEKRKPRTKFCIRLSALASASLGVNWRSQGHQAWVLSPNLSLPCGPQIVQ